MKIEDLKDKFTRRVKICCEVLQLNYEEFSRMPLEQQIGYVKAIADFKIYEVNSMQFKAQTELLKALEEEQASKLDKDIKELLNIVNVDDGSR